MNQNRNAIPKYLYHLTDKVAVKKCISGWLEPQIGIQ